MRGDHLPRPGHLGGKGRLGFRARKGPGEGQEVDPGRPPVFLEREHSGKLSTVEEALVTYEERVAFWMDVYGMTREQAEAYETPQICLVEV